MTGRKKWGAALLAGMVSLSACGTLPTGTQSGKVYEVRISEEAIQPLDIMVGLGDEVRFRNERLKPVFVFFFRDFRDELSCQRGFTLFWGTEEEAKIESGDSASLCFARAGTVGYTVRFDVATFGGIGGTPGETNLPPGRSGAIIVK
jgi:plastocyanin